MGGFIAYVAVGWIVCLLIGLSIGALKSRFAFVLAVVVTIAAFVTRFSAFGPDEGDWLMLVFIVLAGGSAGLAGPAVTSRWYFALPISAVLGAFVPFITIYMMLGGACGVYQSCP